MDNYHAALYATGLSTETLRLIVSLIEEYYEHFGRFPTATQLRALLLKPSD